MEGSWFQLREAVLVYLCSNAKPLAFVEYRIWYGIVSMVYQGLK